MAAMLIVPILLTSLAAGVEASPQWNVTTGRQRSLSRSRVLAKPPELQFQPTYLISRDESAELSGNYALEDGARMTIQSPGYPSQYNNRIWTSWTFAAWKKDRELILFCWDFQLGQFDYLQISHENSCRRFYGTDSPSFRQYMLVFPDKLLVELRTDGFQSGRMRCTIEVPDQVGGSISGSGSGSSGESSGGTGSGSSGGSSSGSSGGSSSGSSTGSSSGSSSGSGSGSSSGSSGGSVLKAVRINDSTCGKSKSQRRVVGGTPALRDSYPWMAALTGRNGDRPFCGASIITEKHILTAAHCVDGQRKFDIEVLVKKHERNFDGEQERFSLNKILVHFGYDKATSDNDIAILELSGSLRSLLRDPDGRVRPVCIPTSSCLGCYPGRTAILSGWGLLEEDNSQDNIPPKVPSVLQEVAVPIISNEKCGRTYNVITDNMICAGVDGGGKDTCQGDSGGPMVVAKFQRTYTQLGIVSFGNGCARPRFPGVYTRVGRYYDWIQRNARI